MWPNLEVFFHGGIAFGPYRPQYARITDAGRMRYWENYNASEGFFAVQDQPGAAPMGLLMGNEVFYEFADPADSSSAPVPAWETVAGEVYELVITSSNGLWRYRLGDTVRIESTAPLTVTVAGRTRSFINAFGEAQPLEIFLVILIAGSLAGVIGMLLAIPLYTVLRVFAKEFFSQISLVRKLTEKI